MLQQFRPALMLFMVLTFVTGVVYPLAVTSIAQLVFPHQANGSLIEGANGPVGSDLIGQHFSKPEYFWGRLSSTQPVPYNAAASGGSNYGPLHPDLQAAAKKRIESLQAIGKSEQSVPVDLVTASASGLDPHISPAAAEYQVPRIAKTRGIAEDAVRQLVVRYTQDRQFGVLGEPRVHVLQLNLALDRQLTK